MDQRNCLKSLCGHSSFGRKCVQFSCERMSSGNETKLFHLSTVLINLGKLSWRYQKHVLYLKYRKRSKNTVTTSWLLQPAMTRRSHECLILLLRPMRSCFCISLIFCKDYALMLNNWHYSVFHVSVGSAYMLSRAVHFLDGEVMWVKLDELSCRPAPMWSVL